MLLLEHTEYEKMCTAPLRDYRRLSIAVISVYFSVFGSCIYSHTFDRLPFGIFSVKRLMTSSGCACSEMLPARHCHNTVAMKTPMSVSDKGQSLHWELGQFYMCPT